MSTGRSVILIVFDGLGDRPNPALGNRTALQAAYRPNLNRMARLGITGLLDTVSPGVVAGSDTSHLSLLGYDPRRYYTGRGGPFEAMGLGIEVRPGDIAFRANFATREGGTITDRRQVGYHPAQKSCRRCSTGRSMALSSYSAPPVLSTGRTGHEG